MREIDLEIKISDYIEGNMSVKEKKSFDEILLNDRKLRAEVQDLKKMLSSMKEVQDIRLGVSFDERLKSSIDDYEKRQAGSFSIFKLFNSPRYASIGAVAAIGLIFVMTLFLNSDAGPSQNNWDIKNNSYSIPVDDLADEDTDNYYDSNNNHDSNKKRNKKQLVDDSEDN